MLTCVLLVAVVALVDDRVHFAVRLDALYLVLVGVVTWFAGAAAATAVAAFAVTLAILPDLGRFPFELSTGPVVWNATATFAVHLVAIALLSALRRSWLIQKSAARKDPLTGLPNRRAVHDRLADEVQRSRRYGSSFAFAYLDLDDFKSVNDQYGHQAGDEALRVVGDLLSAEVRDADVVGRVGGD